MLPSWKSGQDETNKPTEETEDVGNITGLNVTMVTRKTPCLPSGVLQSSEEAQPISEELTVHSER